MCIPLISDYYITIFLSGLFYVLLAPMFQTVSRLINVAAVMVIVIVISVLMVDVIHNQQQRTSQ